MQNESAPSARAWLWKHVRLELESEEQYDAAWSRKSSTYIAEKRVTHLGSCGIMKPYFRGMSSGSGAFGGIEGVGIDAGGDSDGLDKDEDAAGGGVGDDDHGLGIFKIGFEIEKREPECKSTKTNTVAHTSTLNNPMRL